MTELLSPTKIAILSYIKDHPNCTRRQAAIGAANSVSPTLVRDRRRIIALLIEEGLVQDNEQRRKVPDRFYSRLVLTGKAKKLLEV